MEILASGLNFPEGPCFAPDGSLWCVELKGGNLVRWENEELSRFPTGGSPNGLLFDAEGRGWFCDSGLNAIRRYHPHQDRFETLSDRVDGQPLGKPNDLIFDTAGNLIFTCSNDARKEPVGYVCCLRPDGTITKIAENLYFPNGLALDEDTLFLAETYRQRVWKGRWDAAEQRLEQLTPFAEVGGPIGPDGMVVNPDGTLYIAVYGSSQIKMVDQAGCIVDVISLPGANPTNVTFDADNHLIVTEAEKGLLMRVRR